MSRPVITEALALFEAVKTAKKDAENMEPDSQELQDLRNELYRSGALLRRTQSIFQGLCEEYEIGATQSTPTSTPGKPHLNFYTPFSSQSLFSVAAAPPQQPHPLVSLAA